MQNIQNFFNFINFVADTIGFRCSKPLEDKKKRFFRKIVDIAVGLNYFVCSLVTNF
jgi:hypothetical protein